MGALTPYHKESGICAYRVILSTFSCITNIHGFIYFMTMLSEYLLVLYAEGGHLNKISASALKEGKTLYSDSRIIKDRSGEFSSLLRSIIVLRNSLVHWNVSKIPYNIRATIHELEITSTFTLPDEYLNGYLQVLKSVDFDYIKTELTKISPEIKF